MKPLLLALFLLLGVRPVLAASPLYTIVLQPSPSFTVVGGGKIAVYPLSERMKPIVQEGRKRAIAAADYDCDTKIKTTQPKLAVQDIMREIAGQTGLSLGNFINSRLVAAEPTVILMGVGKNSVWHVILTPKGDGVYVLTVSYLIDETMQGTDHGEAGAK